MRSLSFDAKPQPGTRRIFLSAAALLLLAGLTSAQTSAPTPTKEQATVPNRGANIHMSSSSGAELLVVVPKGTVLPVIGRKGEWVQVRLSPELRKTSMVMRWYKNEDNGWMHDSTVVISPAKP